MNNLRILAALLLMISLLSGSPGYTQAVIVSGQNPVSLDDFQLVARGKMSRERGVHPTQIARMDNNGELLLVCREAKTVTELKSLEIEFHQSQLELLVDWNLLAYDKKNKTYQTTIHIYGVKKAAAIRQLVGIAVSQLESELKGNLNELKNHLKNQGREKSMFAVLYAYILHSYAMGQFGEEIYRKPQLSPEKPFWNGYAWAIYPIKKFETGVTALPVDGTTVYRMSAASLPRIEIKQLVDFAKDVSADGRVDNPDLQKAFAEFSLFDTKGKLTIPIFDLEWSKKLEGMAKKIYAKTIELTDQVEMKGILSMTTQAQAAMFLHYEIRYAFLNILLNTGSIAAPVDFINGENNKPADMSNMIFLMTTETKKNTS